MLVGSPGNCSVCPCVKTALTDCVARWQSNYSMMAATLTPFNVRCEMKNKNVFRQPSHVHLKIIFYMCTITIWKTESVSDVNMDSYKMFPTVLWINFFSENGLLYS